MNEMYFKYLSGIITEDQYYESEDAPYGYELQGRQGNSSNARERFEQLKKQVQVIRDFLQDIDTGGKYEMIRRKIPQQAIEELKQEQGVASAMIAKMQPAAYAPPPG